MWLATHRYDQKYFFILSFPQLGILLARPYPDEMKRFIKPFLALLIIGFVIWFFQSGAASHLTFAELKERQAELEALFSLYPMWTVIAYMAIYISTTALSLPGATVLTLAGGALFGVLKGTLIVSFASTIGATLAMIVARFFLQNWVELKFRDRLKAINDGLKKEGGFYLFTLRLIPAVPFFAINLGMGLTKFSPLHFFWISQIGMLPGTLAYVNAGTQLAELESPSGILSPTFLLSFAALGILPLLLKRVLDRIKAHKVYRRYKKPKKFDYNIVVLGAGSGGLISAYIAAAVKAKVALIEGHKMGGDCLNTGCVPSKAIIQTAKVANLMRKAERFGLKSVEPQVDLERIMARVHEVIKHIEPADSVERYSALGVECIQGWGKIISPWEVEVNGRVLTTKNIIIATGASPLIPEIEGLKEISPLHSDNIWQLKRLPGRLLIMGGGSIGCEMAQTFARLGSKVTLIERRDSLLRGEDVEAAKFLEGVFAKEGIELRLNTQAPKFAVVNGKKSVTLKRPSGTETIEFDEVLVAVGRIARIKGLGLEELGLDVKEDGRLAVDEYLRTKYPNIYAVGDVTGPFLLTHASSHQAWHASVNALFGHFKKFKVDYSNMPWCTYTDPEVARVGLSERQALQTETPHRVFRYALDHLDRAVTDGTNEGFVKLVLDSKSDKILGATIVGPHAGDVMAELVLAKRHGLGMNAIMSAIHAYPTLAEANKMAAGVWKKATAPQGLLKYVEHFHRWNRS